MAQTQRSVNALTTTNPVVNGGFEAGQSPWQESTANGAQLIYTMYPHSGSYSAWFCGYTSCNDRLYQTVSVPASPASASLTFWIYENTQEPATNYCRDTLTARVRNLSGTALGPVLTVCNGTATTGWVLETLNLGSALGAYGGAQVQVDMQGTNDGAYVTGCTGNHACNILNPDYHTVGIGIDYVNNTTWLTEDFTN